MIIFKPLKKERERNTNQYGSVSKVNCARWRKSCAGEEEPTMTLTVKKTGGQIRIETAVFKKFDMILVAVRNTCRDLRANLAMTVARISRRKVSSMLQIGEE